MDSPNSCSGTDIMQLPSQREYKGAPARHRGHVGERGSAQHANVLHLRARRSLRRVGHKP